MVEIRQILSSETVPIRSIVLRPGQEISACIYPHDEDESTFHLGAFDKNKLVSIVSFYKEEHPELTESEQYRFRGMATLSDYRGKGIASSLLVESFIKLKELNISLVWCNARVSALSLYEKLGMKIASDEFDIPGIGPHYLMKKYLN